MQNPLSVEGLAAWLVKQDGTTGYNYIDSGDCLLCRYFRAAGIPVDVVGPTKWVDIDGVGHQISPAMSRISIGHPYTYGAALSRARAILLSATAE